MKRSHFYVLMILVRYFGVYFYKKKYNKIISVRKYHEFWWRELLFRNVNWIYNFHNQKTLWRLKSLIQLENVTKITTRSDLQWLLVAKWSTSKRLQQALCISWPKVEWWIVGWIGWDRRWLGWRLIWLVCRCVACRGFIRAQVSRWMRFVFDWKQEGAL